MNSGSAQKIIAEKLGGLAYAGDVLPAEAFRALREEAGVVVDVRTMPEWQFTGMPVVENLLTISWKNYPNFEQNPNFSAQLSSALGGRKDIPLFFLCKSGGRSLDAAVAMTAEGYQRCYNIAGGFEGSPNEQGQRGQRDGWKAANLPWRQG